jgi:hypothetical protein
MSFRDRVAHLIKTHSRTTPPPIRAGVDAGLTSRPLSRLVVPQLSHTGAFIMAKRNRKSVESTPAIETPVAAQVEQTPPIEAECQQPIVETQPIEAVIEQPVAETPPAEPVVEQPKLTAEEKAFKDRYPLCNIVPNTLAFSSTPKFAGKRTALLVDVSNGEEVERATSDFHTWTGYGPKTIKVYRKAMKAARKAKVDLTKVVVVIAPEVTEGAPVEGQLEAVS